MARITSVKQVSTQFSDVKKWFEEHMAIDKIDLNDQRVYESVYHAGVFPAIFQCTSHGAQRLFVKAKPRSILDIAMLTSIYRPGPLAANVDKLYLEAKNDGKQYDWGDARINELLKDTYGLLIFQEGVMMLAEKVAGFPKDKCDEVRRAIMKRSISGGDAAKAKVDEMKSEFVDGAVKKEYDRRVASDLYEKIAYFSGYAFNSCLHGDTEVDTVCSSGGTVKLCRKLLKDVKKGDTVMSRDEKTMRDVPVRVKEVHHNGSKKVVRVTLKTGETVVSTLDHKFRAKETGEMLPLSEILQRGLSIVVRVSSTTATSASA